MNNISDIINSCKKGDEQAWEILFNMFSGKMRTICNRYIGNKEEAEDVLQDSFIKVFQYINQYNKQGTFEGWMCRVFINTSLKYLKKTKSRTEALGEELIDRWDRENIEFEISKEEIEDQQNVIRRVAFSQEELIKNLSLLPDGYRTVFNLYEFEGYTHKEIAALLSISENTSKSQLRKARKYLQNQLYTIAMQRLKEREMGQYRKLLKIV